MAEQEKKQFVLRKVFAILGPAIIAFGGTVGGKWLIGPPKFVKYGPAPVRIRTISALLQIFLNLNGLLKNSLSSKRHALELNLRLMK